jgi:ubiquitin carboxyl-terminal hydrolase 2/21
MGAGAHSRRFQSVDRSGNMSLLGSISANTDKGQTGLRNLGNTCFMNSVLQCLSNTRPLLEFCLAVSEYEHEINRDTSRMKGELVTSFIKLMQSLWSGHDSISPTEFKSEVSRFARRFGGYNQQDAQEFLIALLEGLQDDLNRVGSKNKKRHVDCSNEVETISASDKARESWKKYLEYENSKIVDIFVGQLKSALTCLECGYVSNTFDPFLDLSLPIPKGRSASNVNLMDCFELFASEETLEGDERPTCARCKKRQKCTKRFSIQKFPQVLIIHLKRFSQDYSYRSKLSTDVRCPTKNLDLKKFSSEKAAGNVSYDLYAISNHSGTPSGGHYTASAKNPFTRQWHQFNDQRVSHVSESDVVTSEAYILFYELSSSG